MVRTRSRRRMRRGSAINAAGGRRGHPTARPVTYDRSIVPSASRTLEFRESRPQRRLHTRTTTAPRSSSPRSLLFSFVILIKFFSFFTLLLLSPSRVSRGSRYAYVRSSSLQLRTRFEKQRPNPAEPTDDAHTAFAVAIGGWRAESARARRRAHANVSRSGCGAARRRVGWTRHDAALRDSC